MRATSPPETQPLKADVRHEAGEAPGPHQKGDKALLARVKQRVLSAVAGKTGALHGTVRAGDGRWEQVSPGVERKLLWESGDTVSWMLRLGPGAVVAPHGHLVDEECVVLEGSVRIGNDLVLGPGDFHVGVRGVPHDATCSDTGAVVYLRGARDAAELVA